MRGVGLKMSSGVCFLLVVQIVLSKSDHHDTPSMSANDEYSPETGDRSFLPLSYDYATPPWSQWRRAGQNGDDEEVPQERLGRSRTFPAGTEIVLSDADKLHLEDLSDTHPEDIEEAIEEMQPFVAKHMATMLIAYKLKMLILIPLFVVSVFMLAGSSGLAGIFFLLFVGSMVYRSKHGDPPPYKHELF